MAEAKEATKKKSEDGSQKAEKDKKVKALTKKKAENGTLKLEKKIQNSDVSIQDSKKEVKDGTAKKSAKIKAQAKVTKEQVEIQKSDAGSLNAEEAQNLEEIQNSDVSIQDSGNVAKAGKRSAKSIKEAEEKEAKEQRKAAAKDAEAQTASGAQPKPAQKPRTSEDRLKARGKNYRKAFELIEAGKNYTLKEATELAIKTSTVKFDATVELHIRLNVDPKQSDQNIRDTIVLPAGTGKTVKIAVFADGDGVETAKKAGADIAKGEEFLQQLEKGTIDFDVLIATPATMPKLGKYARLLGPKGLMPNPKSGTVTNDIKKAVTEAKAGKVEYRVDSTGIIHVGIGKVSFGADKLLSNAQAILSSVKSNKPGSLKGTYVNSIYATTTMGPSVSIDIAEIN